LGFPHPLILQPDLVARFCQLLLVACHEARFRDCSGFAMWSEVLICGFMTSPVESPALAKISIRLRRDAPPVPGSRLARAPRLCAGTDIVNPSTGISRPAEWEVDLDSLGTCPRQGPAGPVPQRLLGQRGTADRIPVPGDPKLRIRSAVTERWQVMSAKATRIRSAGNKLWIPVL
jgi:hypothetical protein